MPLASIAPISFIWVIPFITTLAAIAIAPFVHKNWWEKNYPIVILALGAIASSYYIVGPGRGERWIEGMTDYLSFIVLLGALFVISGGIVIKVTRKATPLVNCILLLVGAVIANLFGTTGAAMLLIRPYLRMNRKHLRPYHVVFFIFIVANVGGCLTPVGDPPLFLGYLMGVPFWWVLEHLRGQWVFAVGVLLIIFFVIDTLDHRSTITPTREHQHDGGPEVQILGIQNFLFILAVVAAVFQPGFFELIQQARQHGWNAVLIGKVFASREPLMLAAAVLSRLLTRAAIYEHNEFHFGPMREVAILFAGIFATMIPAIQYMQFHADDIPLKTPGHFYFASGMLSSVLDNAPTYKTFLDTRLGAIDPQDIETARATLTQMARSRSMELPADLPRGRVRDALQAAVRYHASDVLANAVSEEELRVCFLIGVPQWNAFVIAISLGSVFFGACTYIGNGPNLMIKSVADHAGVHTPSFFTYIARYTLPILLPLYVLVWLLFLRQANP
jgi:Na+/H+ antiporter NhaD/arsenite permease-like protein